jgi:hypothetical protein
MGFSQNIPRREPLTKRPSLRLWRGWGFYSTYLGGNPWREGCWGLPEWGNLLEFSSKYLGENPSLTVHTLEGTPTEEAVEAGEVMGIQPYKPVREPQTKRPSLRMGRGWGFYSTYLGGNPWRGEEAVDATPEGEVGGSSSVHT